MSCFDVQILDPNINTIEIETCIGDQPSSIDIVTYDNISTVEINHCIALLPSEINDLISVIDILAGSGIIVTENSGIYTISSSGNSNIIDLLETVQDIIGNSGLLAGSFININYNDSTGYTTVSATGLQPSGNYSVDGHTHTSSNITDFNSSVSGLLPVKNINAGSGIGISSVSGDFIVSVTGTFGLTSEEVDDRISNLLVAGNYINLNYNDFGNSLTISVTGVQPSGNYSLVGHSHNTSDITNFDSGVSGLLPSVSGSGYIVSSFTNNIYTISVTGLQPSGNYSVVGHTHLSSDITNFDSAVSGLIPPSNFTSLTGISGIVVTNSGTNYFVGLNDPTIQLADITDLTPAAQTFLLTSSSTNLSSLMIDKTGSGVLVFNTSPAFSGIPTVPTASSGTNTDQIASTAFVRNEISNLVDSAPITLDTLNELAAALGDDPNFATTITNSLAGKASLSGAIFTGPVTIPSGTGNFNSLTVNGVNVSISGHAHTSSDITNFNSSVSGLLPSVTGTGYVTSSFAGNTYTIGVTGLQPSGNYSLVGHTHLSTDITDSTSFGRNILTAASYAAQNKLGWEEINSSSLQAKVGGQYFVKPTSVFILVYFTVTDPISPSVGDFYTIIKYPGSQTIVVGGIIYNSPVLIYRMYQQTNIDMLNPTFGWVTYTLNSFHTHTSSDITNFNSSVSGLIPVKDIVAGTGIGVTNSSGIYTINSSNTVASDTLEPDGFVNRTDSTISFDDSSREFGIAPKSPATSYTIYNNGVKVVKSTTETTTLPDTTALYFIHFDKSTNNLSYKTTGFNFDTDIPIAHIYYNADDNKAVYFGEERHGIRMDASTHRYLHNVFGTQYINGLSISNYSTSGNGSSNSDATIAIGDGLIYDEDIEANITHSNTPNDPFEQILSPIAQIPVYYKVGSNGAWTNTTPNNYPVKTGITVQYNLNSAGIWSASDSTNPTNDRYIAYWICATTQENAPIISIMGQRIDSSLEQATSNNSWGNLNLTGLPIVELRPLYRLIYDTKSTFSNTPKGFLSDVLDIRSHIDTVTGLTQNDHGNLYGLADDDHYQYVHIDNARTIDAIHNFTNGLGINTSTPSGALHIVNDDIACYIGDYSTWTNGGKVRVFLDDDDNQNQGIKAFISKVGTSGTFYYGINGTSYTINGGGSGTNVGLYGYAGNGARNWGLWIDSGDAIFDDKVGIGTTSPSGKLDVIGNTNIDGLLSATSGNFTSLTVNSTGVSLVGHTHTSLNITDFNSSVSGLLPTISNSGNNRILTSDGTINGIIAESALTFDPDNQTLSGGPILKLFHEQTVDNISTAESSYLILSNYGRNTIGSAGRIQFEKSRGTQSSPLPVQNGDTLGVIRFYAPDNSGVLSNSARILLQSQGIASGVNNFVPTVMTLNTSSGPNQLDNSLILHSDGKLYSDGYLQIYQTNNRLDPSPNSGKNYGLGVYIATSGLSGSVDPNTQHNIYGIASNVSPRSPNNNHTMYYYGNIAGVYSELPSGVANSGAIYGSIAGALRNSRGANVGDGWYDDNGTLSQLIGSVINYGHSIGQSGIGGPAPTGLTSYTANAYGLYIAPQKGYGTIDAAYDLLIADTNYNTGTINNHYAIYQIGNRPSYLAGSLTVDNGLSAPTPIHSLGTVSGNTAISYSIDKQIQKLTLNGTAVNFTEGTGWDIANKSVDVMLEITVSSTTTVSFDAGFVTHWYNPLPTFSSGKYLVLLRSMGTGVVQGHYIGAKTN